MLLDGGPVSAAHTVRENLVAWWNDGASPPALAGALEYAPGQGAIVAVRLRVIRTHRRRRIGSALLERVFALAAARGVSAVVAVGNSVSEPEAEPFYQAHEFRRMSRLTTMDAGAAGALAQLVPLVDRLYASGRVPAGLRVTTVADAPKEQVARLYLDEIGRHPDWNAMPVVETLQKSEYARCPVLMVGGEVAAFVLWRVEGEIAPVPARVVAPAFQGSWANAILMRTGIEGGMAAGGRIIRFEIPEGNRDTLKLARRFGARLVSTRDLYVRELA